MNNRYRFPWRNFRHDEKFSWWRKFGHVFSSWRKFSSWIFVVTKNLAGFLSRRKSKSKISSSRKLIRKIFVMTKNFCHHENWWQNFLSWRTLCPCLEDHMNSLTLSIICDIWHMDFCLPNLPLKKQDYSPSTKVVYFVWWCHLYKLPDFP